MPQPGTSNFYRSRRRRRSRRRKTIITAAVVVVLVAAMMLTAILVAGGAEPASSDIPPSSAPSVSVPAVVPAPPSSSVPQPARQATIYDESGIPALFNRFNYIPDDWTVELVGVGGGQSMDARAAKAYMDMVAAAAEDGITLVACSGFRTGGEQYNNYHNKLNYWLEQGLSEEDARIRTERYHAIPGTSEHEAGLAMDVNDAAYPGARIDDSFADTPAFEWMQEHCTEYGFIYRYKQEAESITHIAWEPWHYRYVGANHAERIVEMDITLEEYVRVLIEEARAQGGTLPASVPTFEQ